MNKHIEITKENDVAKLTIKSRAKTAPEVSEIVDKTFEALGLSDFDKTVFLAVDALSEEKRAKNFPKVVIEGVERPLPLEKNDPTSEYGCEISYLELYRKVMDDPKKTAVSTEDLKPIEKSLEQLSMKFIAREFRLSANHVLGEIFGDWSKELKTVELTDYFLPVKCWHVLSKCGWELGFVSTKRFPAPLPDFVTLAECAYEKRGGIEVDPWYEYQKERRQAI